MDTQSIFDYEVNGRKDDIEQELTKKNKEIEEANATIDGQKETIELGEELHKKTRDQQRSLKPK